jgi:hypothetical protein
MESDRIPAGIAKEDFNGLIISSCTYQTFISEVETSDNK